MVFDSRCLSRTVIRGSWILASCAWNGRREICRGNRVSFAGSRVPVGSAKVAKKPALHQAFTDSVESAVSSKDHGLVRRTDGLGKPIQFGTSGGGGSGTDFRSIASDVARPR